MYTGNVSEDGISVKISIQWLVKNNTLVQQIVVENTGSSSIKEFPILPNRHMLIRDLDYTGGLARGFNDEKSKNYIRGPGPNKFSWITANHFDAGETAASQRNDARYEPAARTSGTDHQVHRTQSLGDNEPAPEIKQSMLSPKPPSDQYTKPERASTQDDLECDLRPVDGQRRGVTDTGVYNHQRENENKPIPDDDEVWKTRRVSDTWSAKDPKAVVSVMSLFVNGTAQKMEMEPRPIHRTIGSAESSSSVLEVDVAYKMIVIPNGGAHWKNFLVPAELADVSTMLAVETEQLWGHAITDDCKCGNSLRDLGLTMVDLKTWSVEQNTNGDGQALQGPGITNRGTQRSKDAHDNTTTTANLQMDVKEEDASTKAQSVDKHEAAQDTTATPSAGVAVGSSPRLSPINNIEYLTWRHMEHILSVCCIPLSVPILSREDRVSEPTKSKNNGVGRNHDEVGTSKGKEIDPEVPLALTCGDMSGHRICTSASL